MNTIEERIQRLEDIEAIKQLKARYLHACDKKDLQSIERCFPDSEVIIDYGAIGRFEHRSQLIEVFTTMAVNTQVIDAHHGQNPQISIESQSIASAIWDLYFFQVNPENQQLTQLTGTYHDKYQKVAGEWLITETVFNVRSTLLTGYKNIQQPQILFAGAVPHQ